MLDSRGHNAGFSATDSFSGQEDQMRSLVLFGTLLVVGALTTGTVATSGDRIASMRQWAIVYLTEPTLVGSTIVQGPVVITHDGTKMARGEPCTTVQLFEPKRGPVEEVASFHCIPTPRPVVQKFTIQTRPNVALGFGCVLTEYQFAGEAEAHGVPTPADGQ
jgi:hypothetical protein